MNVFYFIYKDENKNCLISDIKKRNRESLDSENIETSEEASVENTVEEAEIDSKDSDKDNSKKRVLGDITNTVQDDSSKVRCLYKIHKKKHLKNSILFCLKDFYSMI